MDTKVVLVIVLATLAIPAIVLFFIRLKRNQDEINELIETKFCKKQVILRDRMAFLVAQQSRGYSQRQGNGNLILTADELFLALTMPKNVICIPIENVGEMERVTRIGGKGTLRQMLKIHYTDDQGQADALGIRMKEMDRWEQEIKSIQSRAKRQESHRVKSRV